MVLLTRLLLYLLIVRVNKHKTFVVIPINIVIVLSTTSTTKSQEICSIGSGSVESAVKQVDRRTKISGAQWKQENVPQVLAHRCAYLNGLLSA